MSGDKKKKEGRFFVGCPVCHGQFEHDPECSETEDIRVLEAQQVGDITELIVDLFAERDMEVGRSGEDS